ncbi:hypothetical protein I545_1621 [Mycobacterium kansasii 662]|uniref:Uncharacterized protein n=2 Tax=Mycobacterium kansasii TaxID=1768 RepID=A0A1V3XCB6_MYCKA|nr:hypothetical protein I547_7420 [Mycobacterium kansasii 824]EUA21899.1 hypothetical protein I545_1621 [Mycobacterium kansasii 662]KEP42341.1 hypothetical protein MKSMC1_24930 [Mycobacterium kansasii]OOK66483.1 hypothetical protein BZL30_8430 [Mycobacterium kansasii]OOK76822.1 hypothetical protein BZL29_3067 [Mycobacterium kansasii]
MAELPQLDGTFVTNRLPKCSDGPERVLAVANARDHWTLSTRA